MKMYSQSLCSTSIFVKLTVIWNSNLNDNETQRNEALLLAFFHIEVKQILLIPKFQKDQSKANSAYSRTLKIKGNRPLQSKLCLFHTLESLKRSKLCLLKKLKRSKRSKLGLFQK
jgi:hypothetical protein